MCSARKGNNLFLPNKDKYYNPSQWRLNLQIGNFLFLGNLRKSKMQKLSDEIF